MQRGHLDGRAAQSHRLEDGIGSHRTRTAHVHFDAEEPGDRLLGGKLERSGPPRKLGRGAKTLAAGQVVQFDDDAVRFELQGVPRISPGGAKCDDLIDVCAQLPLLLNRKSPRRQPLQNLAVRSGRGLCPVGKNDLITESAEASP